MQNGPAIHLKDSYYPYLNTLRGIASILIVVSHCVDNPILFAQASDHAARVIEYFRALSSFFAPLRVPLFFVVAGVFTSQGLKKYSITEFLRKRFLRVFIPFVIAVHTIGFTFSASINDKWSQPGLLDAYLSYINPLSGGGYGHLWFLFALIVYSVAAVVVAAAARSSAAIRSLLQSSADFAFRYWFVLLLVFTGVEGLRVLARSGGWLTDFNLTPKLPLGVAINWSHYFIIGSLAGLSLEKFHAFLRANTKTIIFILVSAFALRWICVQIKGGALHHFSSILSIPLTLYGAFALAFRFPTSTPRALAHASAMSYPVYLLHMPILQISTLFMLALGIDTLLIFLFVLISCYPVSFALSRFLVQFPAFSLALRGKLK